MRTKEEKKEKVESMAKEFTEIEEAECKSMMTMVMVAYMEGLRTGREKERRQQYK